MKQPIAPTPLRTPLPPRPLAVTPSTAPPAPPPLPASAPIDAAPAPVSMKPSRPPSVPPPRDWWVYQPNGQHIGPLSTASLARAWLANELPRDAYVGAAGDRQWWPLAPALEILEAARALESGAHP